MPQKRRYTVVHEKLVLEFDVERQSIVGYVELVVLPLTVNLRTIGINCADPLNVLQVLVGGERAKYTLARSPTAYRSSSERAKDVDTAESLDNKDEKRDIKDARSAKRRRTSETKSAHLPDDVFLDEKAQSKKPLAADMFLDEVRCLKNHDMDVNAKLDIAHFGELLITVPQPVRKMVRRAETVKQETLDIVSLGDTHSTEDLLTPVLVRIVYHLHANAAGAGFQFVKPHPVFFPERPHQGFVAQSCSNASLWFPCVEGCDQRCTFDMELTCPSAYTIVASGVLVKTRFVDADKAFKTFFYRVQTPITPAQLGLAIAPFRALPDTDAETVCVTRFSVDDTSTSLNQLRHTTGRTARILSLFGRYLDAPFPHESFHQVFVDDAYSDCASFAGLVMLDSSMLCDATIIDHTYVIWEKLAWSVAWSWVGVCLRIESYADEWIRLGLAYHLVSLFVSETYGVNEAELRRWSDARHVLEHDDRLAAAAARVVESKSYVQERKQDLDEEWTMEEGKECKTTLKQPEPVVHKERSRPLYWTGFAHYSELHHPVQAKKAGIVMKMLETVMGIDAFKQLFKLLLSRYGESSKASPESKRRLSTSALFTHATELCRSTDFKSFAEQWVYCDSFPSVRCQVRYNKKKAATEVSVSQTQGEEGLKFSDNMRVVIHEESLSFDSMKRVDDKSQEIEFPCKTKARRARKRKPVEDEGNLSLSERLKRESDSPVQWVRFDPQRLWFRAVQVLYTDQLMWLHQLRGDRDVVSQMQAVEGIGCHWPRDKWPRMLTQALREVLLDERYFYRVRIAAAHALVEAAKRNLDTEENLELLLRTFRLWHYHSDDSGPRLNDFSDFTEYFLKQALPLALCDYVHPTTLCTPPLISQLIFDLLRDNDNSQNTYSDAHYVAALLKCLGKLRVEAVSEATDTFGRLDADDARWEELKRFMERDRVFPSFHNVVTVAALETVCALEIAGQLPPKVNYVDFTQYAHFRRIRVAAFMCMVNLTLDRPEFFAKLLGVLETEATPGVRSEMANICADQFVLANARLSVFRRATDENRAYMDRLWHLLNSSLDPQQSLHVSRIYAALYGRDQPPCLTSAQPAYDKGERMWKYCFAPGTYEDPVLGKVSLKLAGNAQRRNRAKIKLRSRRTKRTFAFEKTAPVAAVGKISLSGVVSGALKASAVEQLVVDDV